MPKDEKSPSPEREQTDESLRVEREKADDVLAEKLALIEETADAVIDKARAQADDLVQRVRAATDRQTRTRDARSSAILDATRAAEDRNLQEERADADEVVRVERAEQAAFLSVERFETDKDLLSERARADGAVAIRDEFLGIVSHDLRNMLSGIVGYAALIARDEREGRRDTVLSNAQRIQRSGARMSRLIGDLVDVACIEAGVLAVTREVLDPTPVVTEAVDTFQAQASASGVSLTAEIVPPSTLVALDPARILQVLANLLGNALKFTPRGGKVAVRVERVADELLFSVSDTGSGIPADKLELVFERFRQATTNDRRGVGLGLFISRCIVHGHGGRIWAESKQGEGARFCFSLPIQLPLPNR